MCAGRLGESWLAAPDYFSGRAWPKNPKPLCGVPLFVGLAVARLLRRYGVIFGRSAAAHAARGTGRQPSRVAGWPAQAHHGWAGTEQWLGLLRQRGGQRREGRSQELAVSGRSISGEARGRVSKTDIKSAESMVGSRSGDGGPCRRPNMLT